MSDTDEEEIVPAKKSRRSYTAEKKLEIIEYANSNSIHSASKHYKVDRASIRDWKQQEVQLKKLTQVYCIYFTSF